MPASLKRFAIPPHHQTQPATKLGMISRDSASAILPGADRDALRRGSASRNSAYRDAGVLVVAKPLVTRMVVARMFFVTMVTIGHAEGPNSERPSGAVPPDGDQVAYFEIHVRPLLAQRCHSCHGDDEQSGDVRLDAIGPMLAAELIVPGNSDESFLLEVLRDPDYDMPPGEPLEPEAIAVLQRWIDMGAPWPGYQPGSDLGADPIGDDARTWWAIQPLDAPEDGSPGTLASETIDRLIEAECVAHELTPAPPASRTVILRRLTYDLTGLPPTPKQRQKFLDDPSDDAYERLVDRLLDSPAFGEHQARWWLDLVRYAETDGYRADGFRPHAWRYRDYVIDAFNHDKPYDQFVQEQLAADELFPHDPAARAGLGYLRHWVYEWNIRDARTQWKTILEDLTDTTADVFMGLGLQCAKCHNHKFDPLLQKDYFRLRAYFEAILPVDVVVDDPDTIAKHDAAMNQWRKATQSIRDQIKAIEQPYRRKYRDIAIDRFPPDLQLIARKNDEDKTPHDRQLDYLMLRQVDAEYERLDRYLSTGDKETILALRRELKRHEALRPTPLATAMAVTDVGPIAPPTIFPRGRREPVAPGVPTVIDPSDGAIGDAVNRNDVGVEPSAGGDTTGRRAALALWLTRDNPLVARVIANRIWQTHFGRGLAANPSDFGTLGGPPTHPELLDHLAASLLRNRWSLKSLHRSIVLSSTYRRSTRHPDFDRMQTLDPSNRWYWRSDTRRLSAEQIRDALTAVSGRLQTRRGGKSQPGDAKCRTIYTRVSRNSPDELLNQFDLPQFFNSNSVRGTTTTPLQSLLMINSDRVLGHARALADHVIGEVKSDSAIDAAATVTRLWKTAYGRGPTSDEINAAIEFVRGQRGRIERSRQNAAENVSIETAKMPYRDGQAIRVTPDPKRLRMTIPHDDAMNVDAFTIEAFFEARSIASTGAVRTIASKWNGTHANAGWRFGITGKGSRRKPQTLVLQMVHTRDDGDPVEVAIFSDQHVDLDTPYYAGVSFTPAERRSMDSGRATFYLKDLSNDDEVLSVVSKAHSVFGGLDNRTPLSIGARSGSSAQPFDGLIDDVRLTAAACDEAEILYASDRVLNATIGLWRFENDPGVFNSDADTVADASRVSIRASGGAMIGSSPQRDAWVDLCHAVLNSNEFLYVD